MAHLSDSLFGGGVRPRPTDSVLPEAKVRELVEQIKDRLSYFLVEDTFFIGDALWQIFPDTMGRADYASLDLPVSKLHYTDATVIRKLVRDPKFLAHIRSMPPERSCLISAYHLYQRCNAAQHPERFGDLVANGFITSDTDRVVLRELSRHEGKTIEQLRQEARQQARADVANTTDTLPSQLYPGCHFEYGDYCWLYTLENDIADMVFVDPPWHHDSVHLYREAAQLAAQKLKPGGLLLAISSNDFPLEIAKLLEEYLVYRQLLFVAKHNLPLRPNKEVVETGQYWWLFDKPPRQCLFGSLQQSIRGGTKDKTHHPWGQSEQDIEYYISRVIPPGGLVLDPFAGGATVGVVCHRLGLRYIGTEIDREHYEIARGRLAQAYQDGKKEN